MENRISRFTLALISVATLGLSQVAYAGAIETEPQDIPYPKMVWKQQGFEYWAYFLAKKIVVDIDDTLTKIDLRTAVCGFQAKNQDFQYYHQLGECFFHSYLQHRDEPGEKIVVYSWLQDLSGRNICATPLKIIWNRPDQSAWTTVRQYLQMKFENTFLDSAQPLTTHFIAGSFSLYFPSNELFQKILNDSVIGQKLGPFTKVTNLLQATHFSLENTGRRSEKNYFVYQGQLNLQLRTQDIINIDIDTDINVAKKTRPFYIHGSSSLDIPSDVTSDVTSVAPVETAARKP